MQELRARPEGDVERRVASQAAKVERLQQRRLPGGRPGLLGGRPDRHDDVGVRVVADGPEDAWREGAVQVEGELVGRHVLEHVDQVSRIEGDRGAVALDAGLDPALVVADLGGGRDHDALLAVDADAHPDDVGRRARDEGRQSDRLEQLLAVEGCPGRVGLRAGPAGSWGTGRR